MEQLTVNRFKPYRGHRWMRSNLLWNKNTNPYLDKYKLNILDGLNTPADVLAIPCPHLPDKESFAHRDEGLYISVGHMGICDYRDTPIICDSSMDYAYLDLPMRDLISHPQVRYYLSGMTFRDPVAYDRKSWSGEYHGAVLNQRVFYDTGPDIREERESLPANVLAKIKIDRPPIEIISDDVFSYIDHYIKPLKDRPVDLSFSGRTFYYAPFGTAMPTIQRNYLEKIWNTLPGKNKEFMSYTNASGTLKFGKKIKRYSYPFEYFKLLLDTKIVISPWGWSPWCIRDLEALACGCIVIKPECSNLQIYPDIYNPKYQLMVWSDVLFNGLHQQIDYILNNIDSFQDRADRGRKLLYTVMYPNDKMYASWTKKIRSYVESCLEPNSFSEAYKIPNTANY